MTVAPSNSSTDSAMDPLLDGEAGPHVRNRIGTAFFARLSAYRFEILIAAIAILPFIIAVVRSIANGYTPIGDDGLLLLRSRDVFTDFNPLLGTWSSSSVAFGVQINNPGPLPVSYTHLTLPTSP
jgi:hypothetical protein